MAGRGARGSGDDDIEAEYIAPDLLPKRNDPAIAEQLRQKWDDGCDSEATLKYELLPPGLMRSLISKVGQQAGLAAEYWRDGFYFYDRETGARALVEQRYTKDWAGEIHVQTQRGQAQALLARLLQFIDDHRVSIGARASDRTIAARGEISGSANVEAITPAPEPSSKKEYYVSYAWNDDKPGSPEREAFVDQLCAAAEKRDIAIIRDETVMRYGERISKFMSRIGRGDRIFIVLSDKYLKSAYCMHELFDVLRNCRENDDEFIKRTRVYVLPCAKIATLRQRTQYVVYWQKKFEETEALVKKHGPTILAAADLDDHRWMSDFVNKTADMLRLVKDVLKPRAFEDFKKYGFDDLPR